MKPIGALMKEHRLIERMVRVLSEQVQEMQEENSMNSAVLELAVDFFRTYADRTHHGKEEGILFRELLRKELCPHDKIVMQELIVEHLSARKTVTALSEAMKANEPGTVVELVKELVAFYPLHIAKEDTEFFYPSLQYLSEKEQHSMLQEFWEFDRKLIHDKYLSIVEEAEMKSARQPG
jgi:hemerythrin-like domain-containing protein